MPLYPKFLAVLIPSFLVMGLIGVWVESQSTRTRVSNDTAQRVGALAANVATTILRHDAATNARLANDLLAPLGNEPSVVCAEYQNAGQRVASYPQSLGCRNAQVDEMTDIDLGPGHFIRIGMTHQLITQAVAQQTHQSLLTFVAALGLTVISASIGFRLIVGRRLQRLNRAITQAAETGERALIMDCSNDEIGQIFRSYNEWVQAENALENALRETNQQLSESAQRDPLTGLHNRLYTTQNLDPLPVPTDHRCGFVALIDIDHFKSVNDTYGHDAGDQVLAIVAQRLRAVMREDCAVVRWGGEEFLIVTPHAPADIGPAMAQRLLNVIRQNPIETRQQPLAITASIGMTPCNVARSRDLKSAVDWADKALYAAKRRGRDRACVLWSNRDTNGDLLGPSLSGADTTWIIGQSLDRRQTPSAPEQSVS